MHITAEVAALGRCYDVRIKKLLCITGTYG